MTPPKKAKAVATKMTKLKLLHRRRTNVLGSAELIKSFNEQFDVMHCDQLPVRIERLDALWREFEVIQDEIEVLEDEEEQFSDLRKEFQTMYFELKASLQSKLPPRPSTSVTSSVQAQPIAHIRLPEISLKQFSGRFDDWVSFRDLFVSLIHNNQQLSAVQKLHYLRATLSGEAAGIISSLELSANNYTVAWTMLKERFEHKTFLIKRHMSALLALSPVKKESSVKLSELADEFDRHVQLLDKLENAVEHWNSFLVERLSSCLDPVSLREWETQVTEVDKPTYKALLEFVHKRSRILQTLLLSQTGYTQTESKPSKPRLTTAHVASDNVPKCPSCKQAHLLFQCDQFRALPPQQRFEFVKKRGLCINCLKGTHLAKDCSSGSCKSCAKKHHSLLHLQPVSAPTAAGNSAAGTNSLSGAFHSHLESSVGHTPPVGFSVASPLVAPSSSSYTHSFSIGIAPSSPVNSFGIVNPPSGPSCKSAEVNTQVRNNLVMLSTAVIKVKDADDKYQYARALLDSGSQPSFITEALCQKLRLKRIKLNSPVSGIGQSTLTVHHGVMLSLASRFGEFKYNLDCLVLPKLTVSLPSQHIDVSRWRIPRNLPLADPQFNVSQGVDIIIGAELFFNLLDNQQLSLAAGYPILQKTVLGYIVCGKVAEPVSEPTVTQCSHVCAEDPLDSQLERFWEIENFDDGKAFTSDEQFCEDHFTHTVSRDQEGRYQVRLPMRQEMLSMLGDSYTPALRRFLSMEKKFVADEALRQEYKQFMQEYDRLGHMEVLSRASCSPQFFLPHHAIHRPESSTTKIRVVFDGSSRGSTQLSLNDVLYAGPTVQPALYSTVINFRLPRFAITADVEKMFRQILVHPEDRRYQQILWRNDPSEPIRTYQLRTVTYGLASSPYHATRILNQLATDEGERFPLAVPIIQKGTYVDDVLSGHDDHQIARYSCKQLMEMLQTAGFVLRKWASNDPSILVDVPPELWDSSPKLEIDRSSAVKTLGLLWFPQPDTFKFKIPTLPELGVVSKRIVVSEMARLFDPLGLLGPVVMNAKMFVQQLWAENLPWDNELSEEQSLWWKKYRTDIHHLQSVEIPRRVLVNASRQYSLHCFCDASKRGYGCCVYVISPDDTGMLHSRLLTSKSRVAPLRGQTIPRLELSAALLGSQLMDNLQRMTEFKGPVTFWTDSTIVLHWIKSQSSSWKVFVSNRAAEVQRLTKGSQWRHVPTEMNPADRISRGSLPSDLLDDKLWWHGPSFVTTPVEQWPQCVVSLPDNHVIQEESRTVVALHVSHADSTFCDRFSDLAKLIRTVAYCYRFYNNCKLPISERITGALASSNCQFALKILVRLAQATAFPAEVRLYQNYQRCVVNSKELGSKSLLRNLNCLMDDFGLLRLDGRLRYKNAPFDTRFPMILPADHKLTWLIARSLHVQTLHAGPTLLLATIRQRFWPLRGRHLARRVVRNCITCYRCNPRCSNQQMAPLPSVRATPARAFAYSGMDYCGPFLVRPLVGRGASVKIYVALFVCLVVKAVHLEVVADLTSVACINAVKRFVARRGQVFELHCDNATAFVGADRELKAARQAFREQFRSKQWDEYCTTSGITFRFIPARSPHFGGLWEAGIKSFKYHFRRIMGCKAFNMDQLLTVVAQIESVLNSRPLAPLSDSPDDTSALTPGHFLIGEPLFSIPEPDLCDLDTKRLSRLQDMKRSAQDLWRRWSRDYLSQLQQRSKWKKETADVEVGQLVLMKQDNTPSLQWPLGRITETIVGPDGHVRVVVVKTAAGTYKRAVTEIAVLPIDEENSQLAVETDSFNGGRHVGDSISAT
ncbi:uncharacterized protein LOC131679450 [Topomyia yanbarensis]|uniref:uncharacterized protein LOC131679450 n=1 Tax=Topomyia yanbarensis TaxID=2498891 RepID=UPI00273A953C|nr:uncharacterized protein LOC131679450 [Topomyia yanbarensis]